MSVYAACHGVIVHIFGLNPKNATASQGDKYIEWSEEWICPELCTVAI